MTDQEVADRDQHQKFNYKIHTAIDLIKLGIVLDAMVEAGRMHPNVAKCFDHQAVALLKAIANENNRAFGMEPSAPIR